MADWREITVTANCQIDAQELQWRFSGSGGPGGQHANTANTRVELIFDIAGSHSLTSAQRARLLERLGSSVRIVASEQRSQSRNRELAIGRLAETLRAALKVTPPRRPTRPTKGSNERRLQSKLEQSERKRARQIPGHDE